MSKSVKHSSKSGVQCPKVWNISQNQGSNGQKCEAFVKIRGRVSKSVKLRQNQGSGVQKCETFVTISGLMAKSVIGASSCNVMSVAPWHDMTCTWQTWHDMYRADMTWHDISAAAEDALRHNFVKHSSNSGVRCPKVWTSKQIRGRVSKAVMQ